MLSHVWAVGTVPSAFFASSREAVLEPTPPLAPTGKFKGIFFQKMGGN